jgi:hypothetical protein
MKNNFGTPMTLISRIYADLIKRLSNAHLQWENRRLLARINKFYSENEPDEAEKLLLEKSRKSMRKLIKDEW